MPTLPERLARHRVAQRFLAHGGRIGVVVVGFDAAPDTGAARIAPDMSNFGCSWLLRGSGSFVDAEGTRHDLRPGSACFILPGQVQELRHDPGYGSCYVCLDRGTYAGCVAEGLLSAHPQVFHPGLQPDLVERLEAMIDWMKAPAADQGPPRRALLEALLVLDELRQRAVCSGDETDPLAEARRRMERNLDQDLPLPELAAACGLGYHDFRRRFRLAYGVAPGAYRIRCRVEAACRLLADHGVEEVARRLGYCDAFAFSRQFRRHMGLPPRRYRQLLRSVGAPPGAARRPAGG